MERGGEQRASKPHRGRQGTQGRDGNATSHIYIYIDNCMFVLCCSCCYIFCCLKTATLSNWFGREGVLEKAHAWGQSALLPSFDCYEML